MRRGESYVICVGILQLNVAVHLYDPPPLCCWNTSIVSPSSISKDFGVSPSLILVPSNENLMVCMARPALSQYVDISFFSAVCFLILNCTMLPSCPITFRLICSGVPSSFAPSDILYDFLSYLSFS